MVIQNYPNLQSIVVREWALDHLNSLKICNCEKLKNIEIKDGVETQDDLGEVVYTGALKYVDDITIESNSIKLYYHFYLPNLQSLKIGNWSLCFITNLTLSSNSIKYNSSINLPKLQSFQTGYKSFYETTSLSLSSNSIQFYFSLYLPKLQSFQTGYKSFYQTTSLSLSSRVFLFLFM